MKHILVIDDDAGARTSLQAIFKISYEVKAAADAAEGKTLLSAQHFDLVLLDVIMPGINGIEMLKFIQRNYSNLPVIMVSASTSVKPVVEAIKEGAVDYITKPFDVDAIRLTVERTLKNTMLKRKVEVLEEDINSEYAIDGIIGNSDLLKTAMIDAQKAARTSSAVIIHGESGTGKELIARYIHNASERREEPFVAVHCASISESLLESELFGHEKGAFTGADKRKLGRFDMAGSGTLFFDEISEMTVNTQVKLLRVLQEKDFMRVGGTQTIQTDARIITASNRDIKDLITDGTFREDLYYRLNVIPIYLPSLRDRRKDIPALVRYYLSAFCRSMEVKTKDFTPEAFDLMENYNWPGNIRELKNIVERMLVLFGDRPLIHPEYLPEEFHRGSTEYFKPVPVGNLEESVNAYERNLVEKALEDANGIQTRAAEILGTTRRILKYRMDRLNINAYRGSPRNQPREKSKGQEEEEISP